MSKKLVYICSPLRGDYEKNTENAKAYCRLVMKYLPNVIPIAPHVYFPQFMDDADAEERRLGMAAGIVLLGKCDELWAFGIENPSKGMRAEIEYAKEHGIPVFDGDVTLQFSIHQAMLGGMEE